MAIKLLNNTTANPHRLLSFKKSKVDASSTSHQIFKCSPKKQAQNNKHIQQGQWNMKTCTIFFKKFICV